MTVYIRARDGVPVSEEEALTGSGALKDGYRCSMGHIARDSAPPGGNSVFMRDAGHINDAIAQIPDGFRAKVWHIIGHLQSDSPQVRDDAVRNGRALVAQLTDIAQGHGSSPLITDSCRPVCARVADHLSAHLDVARSKDGNDAPTQLGDAATEYQRMLERNRDAWKMGR